MNKKQTGGIKRSTLRKREIIHGGGSTYDPSSGRESVSPGATEKKTVTKTRRKGKIGKLKSTQKLLSGEKGSTYSVKIRSKTKDGKLKKRTEKIVDRHGRRKSKTKTRVNRKGQTITKKVVWEDGKRKVIKTIDGKVVKKKGYQTGGFIEPPIEEI